MKVRARFSGGPVSNAGFAEEFVSVSLVIVHSVDNHSTLSTLFADVYLAVLDAARRELQLPTVDVSACVKPAKPRKLFIDKGDTVVT
jgi:hypothetical protein